MSESDSFISEVTEEVRRERLFGTLRRYRWLIVAAVLLIVGAAAWHEWSQARSRAAAEAAGDAFHAALAVADPTARAEALAALPADASSPLIRLAEAGARLEAGDRTGAASVLAAVADDGGAAEHHRALAALQRVMILGPELDDAERLGALEGLAAEGAPYRLLALEQRALARLESGDAAAARADLEAILASPVAPEGLRTRAQQLALAAGAAADTASATPGG